MSFRWWASSLFIAVNVAFHPINAVESEALLTLSIDQRYDYLKRQCSSDLRELASENPRWAYEKFMRDAADYKSFVASIEQVSRGQIPQLKLKGMRLVNVLTRDRTTETRVYSSNGTRIHLKVRSSDFEVESSTTTREEAFFLRLNALGIGARLVGTAFYDGKYAIGTEYIPIGLETKYLDEDDPKLIIRKSAIREILSTGEILDLIGFSDDLNFIISEDGRRATVIAPAYFSEQRNINPRIDPRKAAHQIVESLTRAFQIQN